MSGAWLCFAGSSAVRRPASKTANESILFPEWASGPKRYGRLRAPFWNVAVDQGGHALEHIVAKHEVVKESRARMALG